MDCEEQLSQALREIDELKAALEASSARAQSATEEMQLFAYAVSHDLRQPLRTVSGFAQLLARRYTDDSETSELTSLISAGVAEINTLLEELLQYSRVSPSPSRKMIKLSPVVQWAWSNVHKQVVESGAELRYQDLPDLAVDESQFVQLFQNLFENSLKFRAAAPPKIEVAAKEDVDGFTISVRDNGVGIDAKYHDVIFAPFKRLHGKDVPGVGLGLAICRKIVQAHGGKLWVESEPGSGAIFKFTVPF